MNVMVARFQKMNWCEERRVIHSLLPGMETYFHPKGHHNLHNHVRRLNDAYEGERVWELSKRNGMKVVKRIK